MKKLIFGLITTFMLNFVGYSQNDYSIDKLTNEEVRIELAKGFISFNQSVESVFKESESLEDFKKKLCGSGLDKITSVGDKLLDKSYKTLKEGTTKESILKEYKGKEMAEVATFLLVNNVDDAYIFGGSPNSDKSSEVAARECRWYQVGCHLGNFWNWLTSPGNLDKVKKVLEILYYITYIF